MFQEKKKKKDVIKLRHRKKNSSEEEEVTRRKKNPPRWGRGWGGPKLPREEPSGTKIKIIRYCTQKRLGAKYQGKNLTPSRTGEKVGKKEKVAIEPSSKNEILGESHRQTFLGEKTEDQRHDINGGRN